MSSDSEPDVPSPWIASDDVNKETEQNEREVFARAQKDMESKTGSVWTTRELVTLIRASRSNRLASRAVKKFAKAKLAAIWSPDLASVTPEPLDGAVDALMTARYGNLPQVSKRALYELMRRPDLSTLHDTDGDLPTEFFLSDRQFFRLFLAREALLREWRVFVTVPPVVLEDSCPYASDEERGGQDDCSPARSQCARSWEESVGERMLSEEHRYDPICSLDALAETDWFEDGICIECVVLLQRTCWEKKRVLWKMLDDWLGHAEYDEDEDVVEVTPWSSVWPDWDSGDEIPDVQEKKRKVEDDDDVKIEEGKDPLLVNALAANTKQRKKVKVEAVSKNVPRPNRSGEETVSGTKIKREPEEAVSANGSESGKGKKKSRRSS